MFRSKRKTKAFGMSINKIGKDVICWSSGFGILLESSNVLPIYIPKCDKFKLDLDDEKGILLIGFRQRGRNFVIVKESDNSKVLQRTIIFFAKVKYKKDEIIDIVNCPK